MDGLEARHRGCRRPRCSRCGCPTPRPSRGRRRGSGWPAPWSCPGRTATGGAGSGGAGGGVELAGVSITPSTVSAGRRATTLTRRSSLDDRPASPPAARRTGGPSMADNSLEEFEQEARGVPRRARVAARGGAGLRLGPGLRQGHALRREGPRARAGGAGQGPGVAGHQVRRRLRLGHRPVRLRRPRAVPGPRAAVGLARGPLRGAEPVVLRHRARHGGPDDPRPRHRRGEGPLPAPPVPGRARGLPALLRARGRLGPGQPPDQGRARRRRVADHGPEGVDLGRAVLRHRRDHLPDRPRPAQAQGPDRLHRRHASARRGDPAAAPDDRRRQLQRGLLQRGPRAATTIASATSTRAGRWR